MRNQENSIPQQNQDNTERFHIQSRQYVLHQMRNV